MQTFPRKRGRPSKLRDVNVPTHTPLAQSVASRAFHRAADSSETASHKLDTGTTDHSDAISDLPLLEVESESAGDKPPASVKRQRRARNAGTTGGEQGVIDGLAQLYTLLGISILPFNNYDGQVIMERAQPMAASAVGVARHNPRMMKFLRRLAVGSEWGEFAVIHIGVGIALGANHGMVKRELPAAFNLPVPPEREPVTEKTQAFVLPRQQPTTQPVGPRPATQPGPESTEPPAPGLHITPEIANRLAEQAIAAALAEQEAALRNGAEGVPKVNPNDLTGEVRRI